MSEFTSSQTDSEFLDSLFESALGQIENGQEVNAQEFTKQRPGIEGRILEAIRTAREVANTKHRTYPQLIGYSLLAELGRGGMGTVYLARQRSLGDRLVALKVLPTSNSFSTRARDRFETEVRAIARLRHPNVVAIHDVIHENGVHAYAMEWVDGKSLAQLIEHLQNLPRENREVSLGDVFTFLGSSDQHVAAETSTVFFCRLGIAIARSLGAVHREGLTHRDVKPSNILLRCDGMPLLTDFGLARETDTTIVTQTGHFVGTPAYASPEQLRGDQDCVDARSDIYSLGATLYHALTLQVPFSGRTPGELLNQIESGKTLLLRTRHRRFSRDLETIIAKAMEPSSQRRYATADELADDLERLLNLQPIKAKPATMATRTWKAVRRNRASLLGVLIGSVMTLSVASAVAVYFLAVPRWVKHHVDQARLTLLHPEQGNQIFTALFWNQPQEIRPSDSLDSLAMALEHYQTAIRLSPFDDSLRNERDVVKSALDTLSQTENEGPDQERVLEISTDSRAQGLFQLLTGNAAGALNEWSRLDPLAGSDPFVEAALGVLHLANGEPARAYPRLQRAVEAFPNVSFLTQYLADAAIQCGDLDRAERLIERGRTQVLADKFSGLDRATADLYAAQGRDEDAIALYKTQFHNNPVAEFNCARLFESRGRFEEAVHLYARVLRRVPSGRRSCEAFVRAMERWWGSLSDKQHVDLVRPSLDGRGVTAESLVALLRPYVEAKSVAAAQFGQFQEFPTLPAQSSSPYLQRDSVSLMTLAGKMEVSNVKRWNCLIKLPSLLKNWLAESWVSPTSSVKGAIAEWCGDAWCAMHSATRPRAIRAPSASAGIHRRSPNRSLALPALMGVAAISTAAHGQCPPIGFQGLGDLPGGATESLANGLSKDGTTVVGQSTSAGGPEAFRWTASTNMVGLGDAPGGAFGSFAWDVSADGSIVSGWTLSGNGNCVDLREAFRWTEVDGLTLLGDLPGGCYYSAGTAISDDGSVIAGVAADDLFNFRASYWTAGAGWVGVGPAPSSFASMSADGTVMGGGSGDGNVIRWTSATGVVYLGDLQGGAASASGYGMSDDGNIIVGYGTSATGLEAIRWTQATGIVGLGDLPGGSFESYAPGINADGSIIVGYGNSVLGQEAVMWINGGPIQRVVDVLADNGVAIPCGWTLTFASAVTVNCGAVTLVGHAINANGDPEAWIASYRPSAPLVGFFGLGDLSGGTNYSAAYAVSADGTTAVGDSISANPNLGEAFRWRTDTGMVGLGDLPGADHLSIAYGVSADGSVITGWSSSGNSNMPANYNAEAYRWTASTGMVGLGDVPGGNTASSAIPISDDGLIIGGAVSTSAGVFQPAIWTQMNGWIVVDAQPRQGDGTALSRSGAWFAGYVSSPSDEAFRWSAAGGFEILGDLPGGSTLARAGGVSNAGEVVGNSSSSNGSEAFRWIPGGGMVGLGDLPGAAFVSGALNIAADGSLIVGFGTTDLGEEAVLWDESLALHRVADVLADNGVNVPCDWLLQRAYDITINCGIVTIVGYGTNESGEAEAFLASYISEIEPGPCDDGDACTINDTCSAGTCSGTPVNPAIDCNDNNACTTDSCNSASGCQHADISASCNDNNSCTTDSCNPASGCVNANNTNACDDTNACTTSDVCGGGACAGTPVNPAVFCNDNNLCTNDGCNPATGCTHANNTNPCDDNNSCTTDDVCSSGDCAGILPPWGDVHPVGAHNGVVNLDDILCVLNAFTNPATCPDADLKPCGGNGVVNLDDILGVLASFGGANQCPCVP